MFSITSTRDANSNGGIAFGGGAYLVVYQRLSASLHKIYGSLVASDGTVGAAFPISSGLGSFSDGVCTPAVVFDGSNFLVVWIEESTDPSLNNLAVKARFVSPSGAVGTEFTVSAGAPAKTSPSVAYNGSRYFVVWNAVINPATPPAIPDYDVLGQQVTTTGALSGGAITVATGPGFQFGHVSAGGANFLVIWDDLEQNPLSYAVKGKLFDGSGIQIGAERTLFTPSTDGRVPGVGAYGHEVFHGGQYFVLLVRATPPPNPFDFNAYMNFSLDGAFITP
jgi:hypothetical protein